MGSALLATINSRTARARVLQSALALLMLGCSLGGAAYVVEAVADSGRPEESAPRAAAAPLNAHVSYDATCSPFAAAQWERGHRYARTVVSSTPFEQCVSNTMRARYIACGDEPNSNATIDVKVASVMEMLRQFNNNVQMSCAANGSSEAAYQGYKTYGSHDMTMGSGYHESLGDWNTYGGPGREFEPWNWRVGDSIHEFMHTHDYVHVGGDNCTGSGDCTDANCQWTTRCGGSGVPPRTMTWSTAGASSEEFCASRWLGDDRAYYSRGEPSAVYIADSCGGAIVQQSRTVCKRKATDGPCAANELYLLKGWTGKSDDPQDPGAECGCVADPRTLISLSGRNGRLSAIDGGGREIRTSETTAWGPWQTFYAIDYLGQGWMNYDFVQLKTFGGNWVNHDFSARRNVPWRIQIGSSALGLNPLRTGASVTMRSNSPIGDRYASDNGANLSYVSVTSPLTDAQRFYLEVVQREQIVYLRGAHGGYITEDSNGVLWNTTPDSTLADTRVSANPSKAAAAFWILDWNGGNLESGDSVSLQGFRGDRWHYVSTSFSPAGQMRMRHSAGRDERFVIRKVSGTPGSMINDKDVISLRSRNGNYVTAMPADASYELRNAGTWEGPWQRFTLRMVQHHDRFRATW